MPIPDPKLTRGRAFHLGIAQVSGGGTTLVIPIPEGWDYFTVLALPNWNTGHYEYLDTPTTVTVRFNTPAPAGGGQVRYSILH
jgi:hypothetical protein